MRNTLSILIFGFALAACGNSTPMMMEPDCMVQCTRVNTLCSMSTDCATFCDEQGPVYVQCDPQVDPVNDCRQAASDANLCTACATQQSALDACIAAHVTDAGTGDSGH